MEIRPLFCKLISRVANNIDICMMHTLMHFTKALYWKALIKDDTVAQKFNLPSQSSPSSKAIKNVISSHRWALPIKGRRGKITNRGLHFKNEFSRRLGNCLMFSIWSPLLTLLHLVSRWNTFSMLFYVHRHTITLKNDCHWQKVACCNQNNGEQKQKLY